MAPLTQSPISAGLAPSRTTLDNGVVVLAKETRKTPAVTISFAVRAGTVCDPAEAPGAMSLLTRAIDRGAASRSAAEVADEIDSRGISLTITVTRHLFSVVSTCLAADFEAIFALLGDIVTRPTLPDDEVSTRKGEVITALRQDEDNPAVRSNEALMALLYGADHPYGRRAKGTISSVEALSRAQLAALHAARFAPVELTVAVVGDVDPARVVDTAAGVLGSWRAPRPPVIPLPPVPAAAERRRVAIPMMNKAQTDIAYGFTTLKRSDPGYYAAWLMNVTLGQYALGGRLGDSIRERQGMAYYVGSSLDANVAEGPLLIRAGVSPANVDRAIASIDEELTRLRREGIAEKELNDSRQWVVGSLPRALETNAGIAHFLQTAEFFQLGLDYDLRMPELLAAVTVDEVAAMAGRLLDPDRATIVVAGPYG
jgi:zinc protease